jgi:hypothetical protein
MNGKGIGRKLEERVQLTSIEHTPHESAGTRTGGLHYSPKISGKLLKVVGIRKLHIR